MSEPYNPLDNRGGMVLNSGRGCGWHKRKGEGMQQAVREVGVYVCGAQGCSLFFF